MASAALVFETGLVAAGGSDVVGAEALGTTTMSVAGLTGSAGACAKATDASETKSAKTKKTRLGK
jgi:hypothetical protein